MTQDSVQCSVVSFRCVDIITIQCVLRKPFGALLIFRFLDAFSNADFFLWSMVGFDIFGNNREIADDMKKS